MVYDSPDVYDPPSGVSQPQITPEGHIWGVYTEYVGKSTLCDT